MSKRQFDFDTDSEVAISELSALAGIEHKDHIFGQPILRNEDKNSPYECERRHLFERWDKIGLLDSIEEDFQPDAAILLENQRLMNETSDSNGDIAQFKRISIPLVVRILSMSVINKFASVQPMLGPTSLIYYFQNNKIVEDTIVATLHKMKAVWCLEAQQDLRRQFNLDAEAELTAVLAQELTLELDRIVLTNMRHNAALKKEIDFNHLGGETINDKWAAVQEMTVDLATENKNLYHRPFPNWIVCNSDMAETICPVKDDNNGYWLSLGVTRYGSISTDSGDIQVWQDRLFPTGQVLLGYKGDHPYDAGYIWAPYVMLGQTPTVLDPDSFVPRKGILCRYGQKLVDPTYFSTLTVKNFISQTQWDDMEAMKNVANC
jgi:hypothetical protein